MTDSLQHTSQSTLRAIVRRTITIYQWAVAASFAFVFAGFFVALIADREVENEMGAPSELLRNMIDLHPAGFFGVGIGLMILAPIVMLADATFTFLRHGDRRYALLTGLVTMILAFSILISFVKG